MHVRLYETTTEQIINDTWKKNLRFNKYDFIYYSFIKKSFERKLSKTQK